MQALGAYLGTDFLETRPDNPTGYWEDRNICELNERVLGALGLKWTDISLIDNADWSKLAVQSLMAEAVEYLRATFTGHRLWGFKDPRTIRLLPFWQSVIKLLEVDECYLLAIRNPLSVAASLFQRQNMAPVTAHLLWLAYMVPYLSRLATRQFVVVDYDVLMDQPLAQLVRIADGLDIPLNERTRGEVDSFVENFLDSKLRHNFFNEQDFDPTHNLSPLAREAYLWLRQLASDQLRSDSPRFWAAWERSQRAVQVLLSEAQP
jgi:O-antigen biosynthesis protein